VSAVIWSEEKVKLLRILAASTEARPRMKGFMRARAEPISSLKVKHLRMTTVAFLSTHIRTYIYYKYQYIQIYLYYQVSDEDKRRKRVRVKAESVVGEEGGEDLHAVTREGLRGNLYKRY